MPIYKYKDGHRFTPAENRVIAQGYPFVQTNTLAPGFTLRTHRHQAPNTHLVTHGSMHMRRVGRNHPWLALGVNRWAPMGANEFYRAQIGPSGVTFVEGHSQLSPNTTRRFLDAGTIVRAETHDIGAFEGPEPASDSMPMSWLYVLWMMIVGLTVCWVAMACM